MTHKTKLKPVAAILGTTFVVSMAASPVANAAENPFQMNELSSGYMVADGHEGKCGDKGEEGKCGDKAEGEGKCGDKKDAEGKCGDKKDAEGKCGDKKETKEGKCGEGKCGA